VYSLYPRIKLHVYAVHIAIQQDVRYQMPEINQSAIKGEPGTGYENEDGKGEFSCRNCEYYKSSSSSCGQEDMMKLSKRPHLPNGRVAVEAMGCCEYVDRIGLIFLK